MNTEIKENRELSYLLYESLSPELKRDFIKKNKNKCVHSDCCGMCDNCFKNHTDGEGKCIACKKIQKIQCPICFDEFIKEKMCKSETCSHYVCWECYGRSFHHESPITSCPSCRAQFTKSKNVYFDNDEDEDLNYIDYESEYDSELDEIQTDIENDDLMSPEIFNRIENLDAIRTDEILTIVEALINESPQEQGTVIITANSMSI